MTTRANRKTRLQAIMIGRCQGHDIFAAFQPMGIFRFWRNGKFNIFKDVYSPSIFFAPRPPPPCFFRFALASSFLVVLTARSLIEKKKHEKIEGCEQSTNVQVLFTLGESRGRSPRGSQKGRCISLHSFERYVNNTFFFD